MPTKKPESATPEALVRETAVDAGPRPLPLFSTWNALPSGFTCDRQLERLAAGDPVLPAVQLPMPGQPLPPADLAAADALKQERLPLTLVCTQWERLLTDLPHYRNLPLEKNPNVAVGTGKLSPLGAVAPWADVGSVWGQSQALQAIAQVYPEPPLVVLLSNNEATKLAWSDLEQDTRCPAGLTPEAKREKAARGWLERYGVMLEAFREALPPDWSRVARFVGYNAFGPRHMARWTDWERYSLWTPAWIDPGPLVWDGASVSYYYKSTNAGSDRTVWSPQVEAQNWVPMQVEATGYNPDFWLELATWDGGFPEPFVPLDRYVGGVGLGLWLLRPRVLREFRGATEKWTSTETTTLALAALVRHVHADPVLAAFWREGVLVENPARDHPWQIKVPNTYRDRARSFLLSTDLDPPAPWTLTTVLPVFALALVRGAAPEREWLVVAHAPDGPLTAQVTIPDGPDAWLTIDPEGTLFLVEETGRARARTSDGGWESMTDGSA